MAKIVGPVSTSEVPVYSRSISNLFYAELEEAASKMKANLWLRVDCSTAFEAANIAAAFCQGRRADLYERRKRGTSVFMRLRSKVTEKAIVFNSGKSRG